MEVRDRLMEKLYHIYVQSEHTNDFTFVKSVYASSEASAIAIVLSYHPELKGRKLKHIDWRV